MRASCQAACLCIGLSAAVGEAAETLYAASVRSPLNDASPMVAGNLYTVDLASGVFILVAPILVGGVTPIGVTGLADDPASALLYGVTAERSPNFPSSLVTIDPRSGHATVIGAIGRAVTDIAFDEGGRLFGWMPRTSQLARIDPRTAVIAPLGSARAPGETGGIAINPQGRAYVAAKGATGTLDGIDLESGAVTAGPVLAGMPFPGGINSLALSPAGVLFAVNTNLGSPANTLLVRIDPATGAATQIGPLPNDTDALVFASFPASSAERIMSHAAAILAAIIILGIVIAAVLLRRSH